MASRIRNAVVEPNPWREIELGRAPYVCEPDLAMIREFNERARDEHRVHLDVYPEPYIGDPDAPILLLNLNPGYRSHAKEAHAHPRIGELCTRNLRHQVRDNPFPFYPIHPDYLAKAQSRWWKMALKDWIEDYGTSVVARAFFCIEYFPYASETFKRMPGHIPSQGYSFALAMAKIRSGSLVVAMRHEDQWARVLRTEGEDWLRRRNPQSKSLNPPGVRRRGNLDEAAADRIRAELEKL